MKKIKIIVMIIPLVLFFIASAVYVYYANAEALRDVQLDCKSLIDADPNALDKSLALVRTDKELGEPFRTYPIETSPDGEQVFHSTLIEYPFNMSPRADSLDNVSLRGIILYVHGYNDYFFQKEMAEKADSAGFAFFAIDLHYCGRSYAAGQLRSDMQNVKEYYAELDAAVELSKRIAVDDYEDTDDVPIVIVGHSLGGLIASLYVSDRGDEPFAALVLDSPFLDMNFNWFLRKIAVPLLSEIALFLPDYTVGTLGNPNYAYSILKREKGEWEYNENVKSVVRPTQRLGWLRAIVNGQSRVHSKLDIKPPVLVMHGNCSVAEKEWTDDYYRCDGVLNVELIREWAPYLGDKVTTRTIQNGMHDLFLSRKDARDNAYREMFEFIDAHVK